MTSYTQSETGSDTRRLPRGWRHLALNVGFWLGFYVIYQAARGLADRDVTTAFWNGLHVIRIEQWTGTLFEPTIQGFVDSSQVLIKATTYTYWLSQFVIVGATLLWVYFKHHDRFAGFRNWLIGANIVGLVCYVILPTAPPRMFPAWGFVDTLAEYSGVNHGSTVIALTSNPYAAMPSLHSMDAFIVGVVMFGVCRSLWARAIWLLWPAWVWFSVIGTGNHYWLDVVAGVAIALVTGVAFFRRQVFRRWRQPLQRDGAARAGPARQRARPGQAGVHAGGPADPAALDEGRREDEADARHADDGRRDALPRRRGARRLRGAQPEALLLARRHPVHRRLGGRHPRRGARAGGEQGDRLRRVPRLDLRPARRGGDARSDRAVFAREGNDIALVAAFAAVIGSFLVSYTRAKAEALGLRGDVGFGSRVERVVLISIGLGLAPWGWLQWPIYLLAAMAWITVIQRILFVRRQLREIATGA